MYESYECIVYKQWGENVFTVLHSTLWGKGMENNPYNSYDSYNIENKAFILYGSQVADPYRDAYRLIGLSPIPAEVFFRPLNSFLDVFPSKSAKSATDSILFSLVVL